MILPTSDCLQLQKPNDDISYTGRRGRRVSPLKVWVLSAFASVFIRPGSNKTCFICAKLKQRCQWPNLKHFGSFELAQRPDMSLTLLSHLGTLSYSEPKPHQVKRCFHFTVHLRVRTNTENTSVMFQLSRQIAGKQLDGSVCPPDRTHASAGPGQWMELLISLWSNQSFHRQIKVTGNKSR